MARIYVESLSKEYKKKLKNAELTQQEIRGAFEYLATKYYEKKKTLKITAIVMPITFGSMLLIAIIQSLRMGNLDTKVILALTLMFVIVGGIIVPGAVYLGISKVPMEFSRYLNKGYPHLVNQYGFKAIKEYAKNLNDETKRNYDACFLRIEDTFELINSDDLVVVGYLKGVIQSGNVVYIGFEVNDNCVKTQVVGIEIGYNQPANQAANRNVALRIKDGKKIGIHKGMVIFRGLPN